MGVAQLAIFLFLNGMWVLHDWFPCLCSQSVQMLRVHPVCRRLSACLLNWRQCETGILYSEPPRSGHLKMREAKQKCQCEKVSLLAYSNAALPFVAITWVGKRAFAFPALFARFHMHYVPLKTVATFQRPSCLFMVIVHGSYVIEAVESLVNF